MEMVHAKGPIVVAVAALIVAACTTTSVSISDRYGRSYDSGAEYVANARAVNDDILKRIEPLPTPLGESAVIVLPTRPRLREIAEAMYTGPERYKNTAAIREVIDSRYAYEELIKGLFPRHVERRNIFRNITVVRADTTDGQQPPADGYLLWYEALAQGDVFHIKAADETAMTELPRSYLQAKDELDATNRLLGEIEAFVRARRPSV